VRGVARGGKGLWFKQFLQSGLEGGLVGLDRHEVITSLFKEDLLSGLHLRMQGIAQHDLAGQVQAAEHLPGRWNLIALGWSDQPTQILPLAVARVDDFPAAVTQLLAINDDQRILHGAGQSPLPIQQHPLQDRRINPGEHPGEGGFLGTAVAPRVLIAPKTQRAQLRLTEGVGELGQIVRTVAHTGGQRHDD